MIGISKRFSIAEAMRGALLGVLVTGVLALPGTAVNAQEVSFSKDIQPVLQKRCFKCHGEKKQKGELRLDSPETIMKGGEDGPVIIAGKPEKSNFYTLLILPADDDDIMPAKGGPLTEAQIKTIHAWITAGAKFDKAAAPAKPAPKPVAKPATPAPAPAPKPAAKPATPAPKPAAKPATPAPAPAPKPAAKPATPAPAPMKKAAAVDAPSFATTVWPILLDRCISCHGPKKQKDELRLDSPEAIMKGSEDGPVVVAGKPEESSLYKLTVLPADDDDIMPAKGDPLTEAQTKAIHAWILSGADFGGWTAEAAAASLAKKAAKENAGKKVDVLEVLAKDTAPAAPEALTAIANLGGLAMPLDMKTPLVRVDFHLIGGKITDAQLATLPPLAAQLTWLNLASTKITDGGLAQITCLNKLTRLHLERTGLSDAGLAQLKGFQHLEYLNLYGTKVTDAGLEQLKGLKNLKKLFLWQTEVTDGGAAGLQACLPALKIDMGLKPAATPVPAAAPPAVKLAFDEGSCCAKAKAAGKDCDHPCCVEARKGGKVCGKCNPKSCAASKTDLKFDAGSCCDKAKAAGKDCEHPCCVEARKAGKVCGKCNPKSCPVPLKAA